MRTHSQSLHWLIDTLNPYILATNRDIGINQKVISMALFPLLLEHVKNSKKFFLRFFFLHENSKFHRRSTIYETRVKLNLIKTSLWFSLRIILYINYFQFISDKTIREESSRKKKKKKMKSLLFQSNISKTRYSKKEVILNLLLDSLCPHNDDTWERTKSRKILPPPLTTTTRKREFREGIDKSIATSLF